jgi:hypothetical protein
VTEEGERGKREEGKRRERDRGERGEREEREREFHILATFLDIGFHHVFYVTFFTGDDGEDILDV